MINIWYTTVKRNIFCMSWILLLTNRLEIFPFFWILFENSLFFGFLMFDVRDVGIMNQLSNTDHTVELRIFEFYDAILFWTFLVPYRWYRIKHSLGISWLCNRLPVFWLRREKDPTRHRKTGQIFPQSNLIIPVTIIKFLTSRFYLKVSYRARVLVARVYI